MNRPTEVSCSEQGQSLVEFAACLVILLVLLAGIVDGGRALFTYMSLRDAAQEGALFGSTNPTAVAAIESRVRNSSNLLQSLSSDPGANTTINVTVVGSACTGGGITVRVNYTNFPLTMPFLGVLIGNQTVGISASVTDTILSPACH